MSDSKYDRQYSDSYLYKRIWSYFSKNRRLVWGVVVAGLIVSLALALLPVITAEAVDVLEADTMLSNLYLLGGALLLTVLVNFFVNMLRRRWTVRLIGTAVAELRQDGQRAALERDMAFYDLNKSGKVLSRITNDTEDFANAILLGTDVVSQLVKIVVLLAVLLMRNIQLTLVVLAAMPLLMLVTLAFRALARRVTRQAARVLSNVNDNIQESVSGISIAKNFRQEESIYKEFVEVNNQSYRVNLRRGAVLSMVFPTLNFMAGTASAAVLYLGASAVINGRINVGDWYLFIQSVDAFWFPFIQIAAFWSQFQQAMAAAERLFSLIDTDNTIQQTGSKSPEHIKGRIAFEHVDFAYNEGGPNVLQDFNLTIKPGESVAFVGHTGAGKSSVARLIMRFYEFQAGTLRIDGEDIRDYDLHQYRAQIGYIPQRPWLFNGTIAENIRYGKPDATLEEIDQVAHSVGEGEWLETLPEGLSTEVGERGSQLSMGQRQLVSLMRVLLQKPSVFILDEATASIDPFTEVQLKEALDLILENSTSVLIAHRLSTVQSADRIIVLANGAIIEEGSHQQLMALGKTYAELYDTYFRHQSLSYVENAPEMFGAASAKRTQFARPEDII